MMRDHLRKTDVVFVEAALIYEAKMDAMFDYVVLVTAGDEVRKKRLLEKGIDEKEFLRRSENQIPDDKKKEKADFVFENNGKIEELHQKAYLLMKILSI
jgi:dephospho-CoA kinase